MAQILGEPRDHLSVAQVSDFVLRVIPERLRYPTVIPQMEAVSALPGSLRESALSTHVTRGI
jgi:hypothetical protein